MGGGSSGGDVPGGASGAVAGGISLFQEKLKYGGGGCSGCGGAVAVAAGGTEVLHFSGYFTFLAEK